MDVLRYNYKNDRGSDVLSRKMVKVARGTNEKKPPPSRASTGIPIGTSLFFFFLFLFFFFFLVAAGFIIGITKRALAIRAGLDSYTCHWSG